MNLFNRLWERSLVFLREDLNTFQYINWIKNLAPAYEDGDDFYFIVTNPMHKSIMEEKHAKSIRDAMTRAYEEILDAQNENISIKFVLESEAQSHTEKEELKKSEDAYQAKNIPFDPTMTFDTFVVGECNRFANQMAINVAQVPGRTCNPLFLYGGPSLGKTHLMHAIGNHILKENPSCNIVYVSSEAFTNEFIASLRLTNNKRNIDVREQFRNRYRNVDVLLIDDIQFFQKKDAIQEEFFHTFNSLHQSGKQIVVTADKPPKDLQDVEKRLIARFDWGMCIDIKPPDYETRTAILMSKAQILKARQNIDMPIENEVYHYIASKVTTDIRKLEGSLLRVLMFAEMNKGNGLASIDMETAKAALANYLDDSAPKAVTPDYIIEMVCKQFGVSAEDIKGKKKSHDIAFPRQVAMYIMRNVADLTYTKIADILKRDYSTVIYADEKVSQMKSENMELSNVIDDLIARIKQ